MKESCSIVTEFGYQAGHVFQDYILTFFSKKDSVDGGAASRAVVPPPTEGLRLLGTDVPFGERPFRVAGSFRRRLV